MVVFTEASPKTPLGTGTAGCLEAAAEDDEEEAADEEGREVTEVADTDEFDGREEAFNEGALNAAEEFETDDGLPRDEDVTVENPTELDADDVTKLETVALDEADPPTTGLNVELELRPKLGCRLDAELVAESCESPSFEPLCNPCAKWVPLPLQGFCSSTSTNSATSYPFITQNSNRKYGCIMNCRENAEVVGMLLRSGRRMRGAHARAHR